MEQDIHWVAGKMLEILGSEDKWTRGTLMRGPYDHPGYCLYGARLLAAGLPLCHGTSWALKRLAEDPYMRLLARIIQEQYPAATGDSRIVHFNDSLASYQDIRAVLEKAWAESLGKE